MIHPAVAELFVCLTCLFEDMHGVVVEGHRTDLSPDMARVLAGLVQNALTTAGRLVSEIEVALQ